MKQRFSTFFHGPDHIVKIFYSAIIAYGKLQSMSKTLTLNEVFNCHVNTTNNYMGRNPKKAQGFSKEDNLFSQDADEVFNEELKPL
eukprot:snap_masked-scaffold_9-processed-gene-11.31-mRNA-1 protein AED:1.00 eAED:1.00 QI:0/-1/0/0/-1/1/1/0/85